MVGYALSVISRTIFVVRRIFETLAYVCSSRKPAYYGWSLLKDFGYLLVVPIGAICPPLGYYLDEMIHGAQICCHKVVLANTQGPVHPGEGRSFQRYMPAFSAAYNQIISALQKRGSTEDLEDFRLQMGDTFAWIPKIAVLILAKRRELIPFAESLSQGNEELIGAAANIESLIAGVSSFDMETMIVQIILDEDASGLALECRKFGGRITAKYRSVINQIASIVCV